MNSRSRQPTLELGFHTSPVGVMSVTLNGVAVDYESRLSDEGVRVGFVNAVDLAAGGVLVSGVMV